MFLSLHEMLTFRIEQDQDQWHAFCPELEGCHTFGKSPDEAMMHLKEAMNLYIEDEIESQGFTNILESKEVCLP